MIKFRVTVSMIVIGMCYGCASPEANIDECASNNGSYDDPAYTAYIAYTAYTTYTTYITYTSTYIAPNFLVAYNH